MFSTLATGFSRLITPLIEIAKRATGFMADAHKAPSGSPSSRRLGQSAAIATAVLAIGYSMIAKFDIPTNTANVIIFLVGSTGAGVVVGKFAEKKQTEETTTP